MDHASSLRAQRREKDDFFKRSPHSPIEPADWKPLAYFEPDEAFRVQAIWTPAHGGRHIVIPTSTGEERDYADAGKLSFRIGGVEQALVGYTGANHDDSIFVPFRDATSGKETYGAGRYLDLPMPAPGATIVDFNLAYNPYCAYSEQYSCPLPPRENWLTVEIRAGERTF